MREGERRKCAIWARVSTREQRTENQQYELWRWAEARGLEVVEEFITEDSAWTRKNSGSSSKGADFDKKRERLMDGARLGRYQVILIFRLNRISRRGAEDMLSFTRRLTETGCELWSRHDSWVEELKDPIARPILLAVMGTVAMGDSDQKSDFIKAGIERRRRELEAGVTVKGKQSIGGRKPGSKNRNVRPRLKGSAAGWTPERKLQAAIANHRRKCPVEGCSETRAHE